MVISPLNVLPTGISGLDMLLGGGLPAGSVLIIQGEAGTGKTLLLQQLGFNWVNHDQISGSVGSFTPASTSTPSSLNIPVEAKTQDLTDNPERKAIFFSTFSEPHLKFLQHMSQFSFFDETILTEKFKFLSLASVVEKDLSKASEFIVNEARHQKAGLVLLDSLGTLEDLEGGRPALSRFLFRLSSQLGILGITLVVSLERDVNASHDQKELTIADGVISFSTLLQGSQRVRRIEVSKLRGMEILMGLHTYQINRDGITVFPRLESLVTRDEVSFQEPALTSAPVPGVDFKEGDQSQPQVQVQTGRLKFNLPELEQILGGGLPAGSSTVLAGSPGTGKTLIGLHYLIAGAAAGERGLYFGFREIKSQLIQKAHQFGLDLQTPIDQGLIKMVTGLPVEIEPDIATNRLKELVEASGIKRLVIDSLGELEQACKPLNRTYSFSSALLHYLGKHGVTSLYNFEVSKLIGSELDLSETAFTSLAENLVLLRQVEYSAQLYNIVAVLKMRDSAYDSHIRQFVIEDGTGISVLEPLTSAQELLSGIARKISDG